MLKTYVINEEKQLYKRKKNTLTLNKTGWNLHPKNNSKWLKYIPKN